MNEHDLLSIIAGGEGQTTEFKESFSASCQDEGIQSLVAFANSQGGNILFGVNDSGSLTGANLGQDSQEKFANRLKSHTYPSLPAHVEQVSLAGRQVLIAQMPGDVPPVIGLYLYSDKPIEPGSGVLTLGLRTCRRVGRTNQWEDIMWLRHERSSDPKLHFNIVNHNFEGDDLPPSIHCRIWIEDGSPGVHEMFVVTEPDVFQYQSIFSDLPRPAEGPPLMAQVVTAPSQQVWRMSEQFDLQRTENPPTDEFAIFVCYFDDYGVGWEARRQVKRWSVESKGKRRSTLIGSNFQRRIRLFPSKRGAE